MPYDSRAMPAKKEFNEMHKKATSHTINWEKSGRLELMKTRDYEGGR